MFVAGTSYPRDVADDTLIPMGLVKYTRRFRDAAQTLRLNPHVNRLVGHSLGASVAEALGSEQRLPYELFNSPRVSFSSDPHSHRHHYDPISFFDRGARSSIARGWNPHSYERGYA